MGVIGNGIGQIGDLALQQGQSSAEFVEWFRHIVTGLMLGQTFAGFVGEI